jgi:hypothetical protein
MDHQQMRRQIGELERVRRADARAQRCRAHEQHDHRRQRREVHGIDPRQAVLEKAAIAKPARLQALQIDVRQDEAGEGKEEVDPQIPVCDQPKAAQIKAQMVLEMVQKHPKRRDKTQ